MKGRLDYITDATAVVFTITQTEEVLKIISIVLTTISILISLSFTLWKWWKEAKKDSKIDSEELKDLAQIGLEAKQSIEDTIEKIKNDKEEKK